MKINDDLDEFIGYQSAPRGLRCPECGSKDLAVIYTRPSINGTTRRRRRCRTCEHRFTTREIRESDM